MDADTEVVSITPRTYRQVAKVLESLFELEPDGYQARAYAEQVISAVRDASSIGRSRTRSGRHRAIEMRS